MSDDQPSTIKNHINGTKNRRRQRLKMKKKLLAEAVAEQLSGEPKKDSGTKSNRQLKRERFAKRQAEVMTQAKESLKEECTNYLVLWKESKASWKFMKAKQIRLEDNKFDQNMINDKMWPLWLEYFGTAHESVRKRLLADANKIIKDMDEYEEKAQPINEEVLNNEDEELKNEDEGLKNKMEESKDEDGENDEENKKSTETTNKDTKDKEKPLQPPDPFIYKRARDIIQYIHE